MTLPWDVYGSQTGERLSDLIDHEWLTAYKTVVPRTLFDLDKD